MAEEEKKEEGTEEEGKKKSGNNMILIIIIVLLVLLLIGGAVAAFFLLTSDEENDGSDTEKTTKQTKTVKKKSKRSSDLLTVGPMYPLDQFIVNLLSEGGSRYLKVTLDLELDGEELSVELDTKKPAVRDIIIRILSAKTYEEISTQKGKERLKNEIVEKINEILADGQINNVFFTDFVIQ